MLRRILSLAVAVMLIVGLGCSSGSNPTTPDKDSQITPEEFFSTFDMSGPVVGEFTYTDYDGNLIASGTLGRNDDGLYIIDNRNAQINVDLTPLGLIIPWVTYNNPQGTIPSGPNAGLPYYYIGQTIDYDINIWSFMSNTIGTGWWGPAEVVAEMRYASFGPGGNIIVGGLLPGDPIFTWNGLITPGYQVLNDTFQIVSGTIPGLDVTTVRISAPLFFGLFDVLFFDGIAGVWDPQ